MGIEQIAGMTKDAADAARRLYITTEALDKYLSSHKSGLVKLGDLSKLKRTADAAKAATDALPDLKSLKKNADAAKAATDTLLSKVPGGGDIGGKAGKVAGSLGAIIGIGGVAGIVALAVKQMEQNQSSAERGLDILAKDLSKNLSLITSIKTKVDRIEGEQSKQKLENSKIDQKLYQYNQNILEAKKQANDALYETRQGRTITEQKIAEAKKQANDALYEARQGRTITEQKITEAKKQANDALYEARQGRLNLEAQINNLKQAVAQFNPKPAVDTGLQNFQAKVDAIISKLTADIQKTDNELNSVKASIKPFDKPALVAELNSSILSKIDPRLSNVEAQLNGIAKGVGTIINIDLNKEWGIVTKSVAEIRQEMEKRPEIGDLTFLQRQLDEKWKKSMDEFDKRTYTSLDEYHNDMLKELEEFKVHADENWRMAQGNLKLLNSRFDRTVEALDKTWEASKQGLQKSFEDTYRDIYNSLGQVKQEIPQQVQNQVNNTVAPLIDSSIQDNQEIKELKQQLKTLQPEVTGLNKRLDEQEKMNQQGLFKLDQIIGTLPGIPQQTANRINPNIPSIPAIKKVTGEAVCEAGNGCMKNNFDDIKNNSNNNKNDILGALNAGLQIPELALLKTIDNKLGAQVDGGISGKLGKFTRWLQLDRVLNLMIFGATIHNAVMLSNDIGQTLLGAIGNVLQLFGLKDDEGKAFDLGSIISTGFENMIKSIIGAENYTELKAAWAKANRIYQATTNILNSFQGLASTILTALEMGFGQVSKIGNALRSAGEVLDNAYNWMNPQPKYNRVIQTLEKLQNGASTIQQVTQAPLDIIQATTELTNSATELTKAIKEDDKDENKGKEAPEPDKLKADKAESKAASAGKEVSDSDLEADE